MQTREGLTRTAYEMMEDMYKDGVCYVETRFAPVFHVSKGLYYDDVVQAVLEGLDKGRRDFGVGYGLIICGMRNLKNSLEMAELLSDLFPEETKSQGGPCYPSTHSVRGCCTHTSTPGLTGGAPVTSGI